jgi:septum formation protein
MVIHPLVLASNSPRRRELLALGGWVFTIRPNEVDESHHPGEEPKAYVMRLAESKAHACRVETNENLTILAADTAVVDGKDILGKPKDRVDAARMLHRLRNRTHQVCTAIAIKSSSVGKLYKDLCTTDVPMRNYSDDEIETYIATGDPLDKAGAYAIQYPNFHPVETLTGCYASVMGLPLCHLARTLRKIGMTPKTDISAECQSYLKYECPISIAVLSGGQVG